MSGRRKSGRLSLAQEVRLLRRGRDWRGRAPAPRSAAPWARVPEASPFPTAWARTPLAAAARTVALDGVLRTLTWTQTRPQIHGADLLDGVEGPVVFVANHASHLDTPLILGSLPVRLRRRVAVAAAADYFFDARWRAVATALAFNAFPIERHGSGGSLDLAAELLQDGWSLLVYPEGTRSQDGWARRFRMGAALLCREQGVPAVPLAVRGTYRAMPRGGMWPKPGRPAVAVRYGAPLAPDPDETTSAFNARLEDAVGRLWIEHDESWWASLRAPDRRLAPRGPDVAEWRRIWAATRPDRPPNRTIWPR
ncbi:lysophospholipid acyltransferase family protein [Actinomadura geliboluensis]|uniref:lysophospholipid acyltransferase family protein n=1 Tax=Actinomadura geliboluensis TaxID=882440 RepID=UPI002607A156|nr:lysophospholipid acyltransferase family protein [Actinomadura geliboluensis]